MKSTVKRALEVFVAALPATMGLVGALSEGIVSGVEALVSGDIVSGAVFSVTAPAGVIPEGSTLKVEVINSESADRAVQAAVGEADIDG